MYQHNLPIHICICILRDREWFHRISIQIHILIYIGSSIHSLLDTANIPNPFLPSIFLKKKKKLTARNTEIPPRRGKLLHQDLYVCNGTRLTTHIAQARTAPETPERHTNIWVRFVCIFKRIARDLLSRYGNGVRYCSPVVAHAIHATQFNQTAQTVGRPRRWIYIIFLVSWNFSVSAERVHTTHSIAKMWIRKTELNCVTYNE